MELNVRLLCCLGVFNLLPVPLSCHAKERNCQSLHITLQGDRFCVTLESKSLRTTAHTKTKCRHDLVGGEKDGTSLKDYWKKTKSLKDIVIVIDWPGEKIEACEVQSIRPGGGPLSPTDEQMCANMVFVCEDVDGLELPTRTPTTQTHPVQGTSEELVNPGISMSHNSQELCESSDERDEKCDDDPDSTSAIIGSSVAVCLLLFAVCAIAGILIYRRRKSNAAKGPEIYAGVTNATYDFETGLERDYARYESVKAPNNNQDKNICEDQLKPTSTDVPPTLPPRPRALTWESVGVHGGETADENGVLPKHDPIRTQEDILIVDNDVYMQTSGAPDNMNDANDGEYGEIIDRASAENAQSKQNQTKSDDYIASGSNGGLPHDTQELATEQADHTYAVYELPESDKFSEIERGVPQRQDSMAGITLVDNEVYSGD